MIVPYLSIERTELFLMHMIMRTSAGGQLQISHVCFFPMNRRVTRRLLLVILVPPSKLVLMAYDIVEMARGLNPGTGARHRHLFRPDIVIRT